MYRLLYIVDPYSYIVDPYSYNRRALLVDRRSLLVHYGSGEQPDVWISPFSCQCKETFNDSDIKLDYLWRRVS